MLSLRHIGDISYCVVYIRWMSVCRRYRRGGGHNLLHVVLLSDHVGSCRNSVVISVSPYAQYIFIEEF